MNTSENKIILTLALLQILQQTIDDVESDSNLEFKHKLKQKTTLFKETLETNLLHYYKNLSESGQLTLFNRVNKLEHAIKILYNP